MSLIKNLSVSYLRSVKDMSSLLVQLNHVALQLKEKENKLMEYISALEEEQVEEDDRRIEIYKQTLDSIAYGVKKPPRKQRYTKAADFGDPKTSILWRLTHTYIEGNQPLSDEVLYDSLLVSRTFLERVSSAFDDFVLGSGRGRPPLLDSLAYAGLMLFYLRGVPTSSICLLANMHPHRVNFYTRQGITLLLDFLSKDKLAAIEFPSFKRASEYRDSIMEKYNSLRMSAPEDESGERESANNDAGNELNIAFLIDGLTLPVQPGKEDVPEATRRVKLGFNGKKMATCCNNLIIGGPDGVICYANVNGAGTFNDISMLQRSAHDLFHAMRSYDFKFQFLGDGIFNCRIFNNEKLEGTKVAVNTKTKVRFEDTVNDKLVKLR